MESTCLGSGSGLWGGTEEFGCLVRGFRLQLQKQRSADKQAGHFYSTATTRQCLLINTMALGGPRRLFRRREHDQGRADDHKNCHAYQFSTRNHIAHCLSAH